MKLFGEFEAIRFPEENRLFVTHSGYLYYIYNYKYGSWQKYWRAGNDCLTVSNYDDCSREDIISAMRGVWPQKETDFLRLCDPSELCIRDMLGLLKEDYPRYMEDWEIYRAVHAFLLDSNICYKSYLKGQIVKLHDVSKHNRFVVKTMMEQDKKWRFCVVGNIINSHLNE